MKSRRIDFAAVGLLMGAPLWAACHAPLTSSDARELVTATPNARAFHDNLGATLTTRIVRTTANGSVVVSVTAKEPKRGLSPVGTYTVNLHTGRVTDEDQEPAGDEQTDQLGERMMARHCGK